MLPRSSSWHSVDLHEWNNGRDENVLTYYDDLQKSRTFSPLLRPRQEVDFQLCAKDCLQSVVKSFEVTIVLIGTLLASSLARTGPLAAKKDERVGQSRGSEP